MHEARFLEALQACGVSKVAIIDDVFDPPVVTADSSGQILEFLESALVRETREILGLDAATIQAALDAIAQDQLADPDLLACVSTYYRHYLKTDDARFDPAGAFSRIKGSNLANTRPVIRLLEKAEGIDVSWIGSDADEIDAVGDEAHLIFVDFYLDAELPAEGQPRGAAGRNARELALDRIRRVVARQAGKAPSVVLMSSHAVADKAEDFRAEVGQDRTEIFASRFSFIEKTRLSLAEDGEVRLEGDVADALLDIVQTYDFGRAVNEGLEAWLDNASAGVKAVRSDISTLKLKELAYLVRFRLMAEGEDLLSYLEWFFGERLLDRIARAADERAEAGEGPPDFKDAASATVEGALDGPTRAIADFYHGVRIQSPRKGRARTQRMGDLYLSGDGKAVFAVLTPDCDLVARGKKKLASVNDVLIVGGKVGAFDAPDTPVADFIMIGGKPHNVTWNRKQLSTRAWTDLRDGVEGLNYIGTLRPLYAQELQRRVLEDLGRVGVAVAPSIAMSAAVSVVYRNRAGVLTEIAALSKAAKAVAYLFPSRGGTDKPKVVFRRQFVMELLQTLRGLAPETVAASAEGQLGALGQADAYARLARMFGDGVELEKTADMGILVTGRASPAAVDGVWCWLKVAMAEPPVETVQ